ncbi:MAG: hypothetical protein KC731_13480 [Myxococcales bacterium]|nr:hypothetical protein [Myxococcales bacterium]
MSAVELPRARELRTCAACGQPAVQCTQVTRHMLNGVVPNGYTYDHQCAACGRSFQTLSTWRAMKEGCLGLMVTLFLVPTVTAGVVGALRQGGAGGLWDLIRDNWVATLGVVFGLTFGPWLFFAAVRSPIELIRNPVARS